MGTTRPAGRRARGLRGEHDSIQDAAQLEIAAHRQGFNDLKEIDYAAIEPGGGLFFAGKKPTVSESQQADLIKRLDAITNELRELRAKIDASDKTEK